MSLRDQLLKAGIVDKKKAREVATDERKKRRKKKGHRFEAQREEEKAKRDEERRAREAEENRRRAAQRKAERIAHERMIRIRDLVRGWDRTPTKRKRDDLQFWYVRGDGKALACTRVDDETAYRLSRGQLAIVGDPEDPEQAPPRIIAAEGAQKLLDVAPDLLRFYVGPGAPVENPLIAPPSR